jgi:hypothetical protein
VQLARRIPKPLHRERLLKPHCVTVGTSVTDFVTKAIKAIEEKLAHAGRPPGDAARHEGMSATIGVGKRRR